MSTPHEYYYKSIKKCEEKDNRYFGCSHENIYTRKITMLVIKAKIDVAYEWSHDTCKSADNFHSLFVPNTNRLNFLSLFLFIYFPFIHSSFFFNFKPTKKKSNLKIVQTRTSQQRFILYIIISSSMEVLFHSLNQIPCFSNLIHEFIFYLFCIFVFVCNFL
jgi:hypothetical protein